MKSRIRSATGLLNKLNLHASDVVSTSEFPIAILDTGAIIDIVQATRRDKQFYRGKKPAKNVFMHAYDFLTHVNENVVPLVVLPSVFTEVDLHRNVNLNGHTKELDEDTYQTVQDLMQSSTDLIRRTNFVNDTIGDDDIRYDIWNLSKQACQDFSKKYKEGYSDVDKDILAYAAYFSRAYLREPDRKRIGRVLVISPDRHIIEGVNFFLTDDELSKKYPNIMSISTRTGNGNENGRTI